MCIFFWYIKFYVHIYFLKKFLPPVSVLSYKYIYNQAFFVNFLQEYNQVQVGCIEFFSSK